MLFRSESFPFMTFPCGWWEPRPRPLTCWCTYLDRFFYVFREDHPILFVPRTRDLSVRDLIMLRVKELRLVYVRLGRLKFVSTYGGSVYSDDEHGCLHVSEIMTVKKFRKMYGLARYFLEHTRPKLHDYYRERTPSSILKFLPFLAIKRLHQVDATLKDCLRPSASGHQLTDSTLATHISRRKEKPSGEQAPKNEKQRENQGVNSFNPAHPGWQWQHFLDPESQSKWCWREADGQCFMISGQHDTGVGPLDRGSYTETRNRTLCFGGGAMTLGDGNSHERLAIQIEGHTRCAAEGLKGGHSVLRELRR